MDLSDTDMPGVGTESHFGDETSTSTSSGEQLVCSGVGLSISQPTEENNSFSNATSPKEETNITPSHYCSDEVSLKSEEPVASGNSVLQLENNSFLNATAPPLEEEIETSRTLKEENDVTTSNYRSEEVSLQRLEKSDAGRRGRTVTPAIQHDEKDGRRIESNGCMSEEEKRHQVNSIISKKDDEWKKDGITNMELDVILNAGSQKFPIKDNLKGFVQMENIKDLEQSEPGMYFIEQEIGTEFHLTTFVIVNEDKDGTGRRSYVYFDSLNREIKWSLNHSLTYLTEKPLQAAPKTCAFFCLHLLSKVCNGVVIDKNTRIDHLFHGPNFDDEVMDTFREVYIRFLQECVNSDPLKTSMTRQMLSIYPCDNN